MDIYQNSVQDHYGHSDILHEFPNDHFENKPLIQFVPVIKKNLKVEEKFTPRNEEEEESDDSEANDDPLYINFEDCVDIVPESQADIISIDEPSPININEFSSREINKTSINDYKTNNEENSKTVISSDSKGGVLNYSSLYKLDPVPRGRSSSSISQQSSSTSDSICENFKFYTASDSTDYISSESSESHSSQEKSKKSKEFVPQKHSSSVQETKYRRQRDRNNEASRKSRLKRKLNLQVLYQQASDLEEHNKLLKYKVDNLERMNKRLRELILHLSSSQKK